MVDILQSLFGVLTNLMFSLTLAALAIILYVMVKWFQRPKKDDDTSLFERVRSIVVLLPLLWMFLNFSSDANGMAEVMLDFWLPLVIAIIVALVLAELIMPLYLESRGTGQNAGRKWFK